VPAVRATHTNLTDALKTGVREGGGHRSRLRSGLTIAQAALSVVLLVGAGLFVRSLWSAYTLDFGFDPDRVTVLETFRSNLSEFPDGPARDAERARRRGFYGDVLDRVRAIPGVERASIATGMPFGNRFSVQVRASGVPAIPQLPGGGPGLSAVTNGYFETMGTAIVRGRTFTEHDGAGTEPVTIVSQLMADTVWPGGDALGKCLYIGTGTPGPPPVPPPCARVVGIAENTYRSRLREDPVMHYYIPMGQEVGFGGPTLLVRSADPDRAPVAAVRQLLSGLDHTITYVSAETIRAKIDPQMRPWKLGAAVFAVSGLLALVVAAIGIYSVMSYLIADRRHEIGVRLALGARTSDIVRLVFGGSVTMAVAGVVIGELIAISLGGLAAPLLFATSPHDPVVFAAVGGVLVTVAMLATLGPARRARRVSAMEALRAE
jgi:putative ABC transport system permease protein